MSQSPARVVVVDDHPAVLEGAIAILSPAFDVVGRAATGLAAIHRVRDLDPDVVVMDVEMPGLNGFEAWRHIHASGSNARAVFFSSFAGEDYVLASLALGASAFVNKARMRSDLVDAVGHALAGRTCIPQCGVLPRWRPRADRAHDLLFYSSDTSLAESVTSFFDAALEAGDALVAVVTEPHRQIIEGQFRARGLDVRDLEASGRYTPFDASAAIDALLVNGLPDRDRFYSLFAPALERALTASTGPTPHVTVLGEGVSILAARGQIGAMMQLEALADEFAASRPISILCGYSTAFLAEDQPDLMTGICRSHSAVVPAEILI